MRKYSTSSYCKLSWLRRCHSLYVARASASLPVGRHIDLTSRCSCNSQDVTPKGRVINRFAKDTNAADIAVGRTLVDAIVNSFSLLFMLVAIAIATKGVLLALFVPLAVVYVHG